MNIASRVRDMPRSKLGLALKVAQERPDVISFGTGEPDFGPPDKVVESVYQNLKAGEGHYSSFMGRGELREAIAQKLKKENGINVGIENIMVSCGSKESIFLIFASLMDRGEEVIVPDPGYFGYTYIAKILGIKAVGVQAKQENDFELKAEDIEAKITDKTRLIVINSPTNPTGAVFSKGELEKIAQLAADRDLYLLSDEAYEKLVYEGEHYSPASFGGFEDRIITCQTFSKNYAMCGFRVGYTVAPEELMKSISNLKVCTTISAPTPLQLGAIAAFDCNDYVEQMRQEYDRRRKLVIQKLDDAGIKCARPKGAFYAFPDITSLGMNSEQAMEFFLEKAKVFMAPGSEFGQFGEGHLRISYATAYEKIGDGLDRIKDAVSKI